MGPFEHPDFHDPDNPYAPPRSAFAPAPIAPLQAGLPFTAVDVFNRSWEIFKARMGDCIAISWGTFAINLSLAFAVGALIQVVTLSVRGSGLVVLLASNVAQCDQLRDRPLARDWSESGLSKDRPR